MASVELEGLEVVLVGAFNPHIFNPDWLARQDLVQKTEANGATIDIISQDISVFSLGWTRVQVGREIAAFSTNQPQNYDILRDLVSGIFKFLRHTPIFQFGINFQAHFKMETAEECVKIIERITPVAEWRKCLENPRTMTVTVRASRTDGYEGNVNVTLEPSVVVQNAIYFRFNDHFELGTRTGDELACEKMIRILNAAFDDSRGRFTKISDSILK